ncbi:DNA-directed RNA polymerase subunit omega [Deinococcus piscis]|uniref:DNA-directed RNA polymerase subunit omega n=1 Tax=Deinococcus piscis TaxID=394230 RepID=A0ABQ3JWT4_9DEIO|nr:DNA-directed RNA polymerase subunit omega [Deinococcus piscis]GHF92292.1 DNA-directed RNA polymerase subunit omega [Deinococcus piscis]
MAEKNIDRMLGMTDSKYRLSVITAKRALQLSAGAPSVLPTEQRAKIHNVVTLSMRELATGQLTIGTDLIDEQRFFQDYQRQRQIELQKQLTAERERERD